MLQVLTQSWALLLGVLLLLIGNGLQSTALGLRGAAEGFSASTMSYVMSAYFVGFLLGSRLAPGMIRRVGHIRVFAALASLISAAFILYAAIPHPASWVVMRLGVGLCFAGVYVVAESWLNNSASNDNRGQALSLYLIVQMVGIITAQGLANVAPPESYTLFVIMSVLVSVAFAPILLSVSPAPAFDTAKPMTLRQLYAISPLGTVGTFVMGGIYSAIFGMSAIFGAEAGLTVAQTTLFIALIYVGGLLVQYPIGHLSDRMDRRLLIIGGTGAGVLLIVVLFPMQDEIAVLYFLGFAIGAIANPLYALLIAYTNDYLEPDDMAAAAGGMLFLNGLGAITGPLIIGAAMNRFGPSAFFVYIGVLLLLVALYALFRMTRRAATISGDTSPYAAVLPQASPVALEVAQEVAIEWAASDENATPEDEGQ